MNDKQKTLPTTIDPRTLTKEEQKEYRVKVEQLITEIDKIVAMFQVDPNVWVLMASHSPIIFKQGKGQNGKKTGIRVLHIEYYNQLEDEINAARRHSVKGSNASSEDSAEDDTDNRKEGTRNGTN